MSNALDPPFKNKEQKTPRLLGIDITAGAATTADAAGANGTRGGGDAGDTEEAADKDVPKTYASVPILGILQMKIKEAARLERKNMINLHLVCTT